MSARGRKAGRNHETGLHRHTWSARKHAFFGKINTLQTASISTASRVPYLQYANRASPAYMVHEVGEAPVRLPLLDFHRRRQPRRPRPRYRRHHLCKAAPFPPDRSAGHHRALSGTTKGAAQRRTPRCRRSASHFGTDQVQGHLCECVCAARVSVRMFRRACAQGVSGRASRVRQETRLAFVHLSIESIFSVDSILILVMDSILVIVQAVN